MSKDKNTDVATDQAKSQATEAPRNPLDSHHAEARVEVGRNAFARNRPGATKAPRKPNRWQINVVHDGEDKEAVIEAIDEREAWAKFADSVGTRVSMKMSGAVFTKLPPLPDPE